jgi:hypothetical protein
LSPAKRIASLADTTDYFWLSDHEFVSTLHSTQPRQAVLHDLATGKETPIQGALPHALQVGSTQSPIYTSAMIYCPTSLHVDIWTRSEVQQALARFPALGLIGSHRSKSANIVTRPGRMNASPVPLHPDSAFTITYPFSSITKTMLQPSPDGKHWAVFMAGWQPNSLTALLPGLLPRWGETRYVAVYTGRFDDSKVHSLGRLILPSHPRKTDTYGWGIVEDRRQYRNLQWLPDGRHLSFMYQGALWTVPVD